MWFCSTMSNLSDVRAVLRCGCRGTQCKGRQWQCGGMKGMAGNSGSLGMQGVNFQSGQCLHNPGSV